MERYDNEAGGVTVALVRGDDIDGVPQSHAGLVTPDLRRVFANPPAHFEAVAARCHSKRMAEWLRTMTSAGRWELLLQRGYGDYASAGFRWTGEGVRGATISLPTPERPPGCPPALSHFYSLVGAVDWNGFGCAGGLYRAGRHLPLAAINVEYHGADVDPEAAFVWGSSGCGDMLIWTADGRGGWANHGTHAIHLIGSIAETTDWIFGELLAGRGPNWDHARWDQARR